MSSFNFEDNNEIRWAELNPLERIVVGFARTASLTASMRISRKGVVATTTDDLVLKALQDHGAINPDRALSTAELDEKIKDRSLSTIQHAISDLVDNGWVKKMQVGRRVKYYTERPPE